MVKPALTAVELLGGPQDGERIWIEDRPDRPRRRLCWPTLDSPDVEHLYEQTPDRGTFVYAGIRERKRGVTA